MHKLPRNMLLSTLAMPIQIYWWQLVRDNDRSVNFAGNRANKTAAYVKELIVEFFKGVRYFSI